MSDKDLDRTLETWADQEAASAPEMQPTDEMYRLVRARTERRLSLALPRWTPVSAGAAILIVLAIVSTLILVKTPTEPQLAYIPQREGFAAHKDVVVKGTPTGKGPQRGVACLEPMFQFQRRGSQFVEGIDLRHPPADRVSLTSEDNYRLLLDPLQDCWVYAFQVTASGELIRLYPDDRYSAAPNPLRQGRPVYVPSQPSWLYVDGEIGQERLYVVASAQPLPELDDLYVRYSQARAPNKPQARAALLEQIDSPKGSSWTFAFKHQ